MSTVAQERVSAHLANFAKRHRIRLSPHAFLFPPNMLKEIDLNAQVWSSKLRMNAYGVLRIVQIKEEHPHTFHQK